MPLKIYYLDDEPDLLELFVDAFSGPNREIVVFSDCQKAISTIKTNPPDLLFIDYRLPNQRGDQIAKSLNATFPIVLVTGDVNVSSDFQFDAAFEKPLHLEEIEKFIREMENQKKAA